MGVVEVAIVVAGATLVLTAAVFEPSWRYGVRWARRFGPRRYIALVGFELLVVAFVVPWAIKADMNLAGTAAVLSLTLVFGFLGLKLIAFGLLVSTGRFVRDTGALYTSSEAGPPLVRLALRSAVGSSREEVAFLAAIDANPADDLARLVYADWLDERGEPRGEYLRLEVEAARGDPSAAARLAELRPTVDPAWADRVTRPPG